MPTPSPLSKKLLVKPDYRVLVLNAPEGAAVEPLPDGARLVKSGDADVVLAFARDSKDLAKLAPKAIAAGGNEGIIWIAYPKKSGKIPTDISRDIGWDAVTSAGWEGVSLVAVDETWSAMRFRPVRGAVRPRPAAKATAPARRFLQRWRSSSRRSKTLAKRLLGHAQCAVSQARIP